MTDHAFQRVAGLIPQFESELLTLSREIKAQAYDIHLKAGQALSICGREGIFFLCGKGRVVKQSEQADLLCRASDLQALFMQICDHSVFSHEQEIRRGYITVQGAYRVGICGTAVLERGDVKNIRDIKSMSFRIPREKQGCARPFFSVHPSLKQGILIAGAPSSGKTTLLRDIIKSLSFGLYSPVKRIAVLDERCELESVFDLGPCADVYKGFPKAEGFTMALRAMSPELIVCDELSPQDQRHIAQSMYCGIPVIASVHASEEDLLCKRFIRELLHEGAFETVVFLDDRSRPCQIKRIIKAGELLERHRDGTDHTQRPNAGLYADAKTQKQKNDAA